MIARYDAAGCRRIITGDQVTKNNQSYVLYMLMQEQLAHIRFSLES